MACYHPVTVCRGYRVGIVFDTGYLGADFGAKRAVFSPENDRGILSAEKWITY